MSEVFLLGPAGKIQGIYVKGSLPKVVLILPPHPKQGGNMKNRTVDALHRAFSNNGFSTLRINFRGVSKSDGDFGNIFDDDFLRDASAAVNWLQERNPIVSDFWVSGFSFGAWMAMNLVMRRPETTGFIAVSPPVARYDFSFIFPCTMPGMIIQGSDDKLNDPEEVGKLAYKLGSRAECVSYRVVEGADYRYSRVEHLEQVCQYSDSYLHEVIGGGGPSRFFSKKDYVDPGIYAEQNLDVPLDSLREDKEILEEESI